MAKAYAFISNTAPQVFTVSPSSVNFGNAIHGFGGSGCGSCCKRTIEVNGTSILLNASGYYDVELGATLTNSAAGNVTLSLYQDGTLLASASENVAAAGNLVNISFPAGVKVNSNSRLTLIVTSSAETPTVSSIYTTVEKL